MFTASATAAPTSVATGLGTIATLPSVAVVSATRQTSNIGVRLASLRRGGPQLDVSVSGLFFKDTGEPVSAGLVESLLPGGVGDGIGKRLGLFLNGQGNFGRQDAVGDEQGFDFHTAGFTLGSDYRVTNNFILGGAIGYLSAGSKVDHDAADLGAQGFTLSAFATYYLGKMFYVDGIATYGWNWYDTERQTTTGTVRGSPDGTQLALSASAGADFAFGRLTVGPYGRVDYVRIEVDSFREHGDPAQTLNVGSQEVTSLTTALGAQASYAFSTPFGVLLPTVRAEWQHEFEDDPTSVVGSLASDPNSTFTVVTQVPDRDYFRLGIGLTATFRRGVSAFLYSDAVVGRDSFTNYGFTGGIRLEF
jgi:outer membrane autotransporter protein